MDGPFPLKTIADFREHVEHVRTARRRANTPHGFDPWIDLLKGVGLAIRAAGRPADAGATRSYLLGHLVVLSASIERIAATLIGETAEPDDTSRPERGGAP